MERVVVGVIRGGPSNEYEVSLKTGAAVLAEIDGTHYEPRDIFISKAGEWHLHGIPMPPERALRGVDVAFNATHGEYGEDGTLPRILETLGVLYTGSTPVPSALTFHKQKTKEAVSRLGVKVARGVVLEPSHDIEAELARVFRTLCMPAIVKPVIGGSSLGVSRAETFDDLLLSAQKAFAFSPKILVEEYIKGKEATVGVVEAFRGEPVYSLFPVEVIPPETCAFFDYEAKYSGKTIERCPGNFTGEEKKELARLGKVVHEALGLRHYSRSDFIVSPRGIYFLEVNTLPGLTKESLFPKALSSIGVTLSDFIHHLIVLARKKL